jgi:hypothetical protein
MVHDHSTVRETLYPKIILADYQHPGTLLPIVVWDDPSHAGRIPLLGNPSVGNPSWIIHGPAFYSFS